MKNLIEYCLLFMALLLLPSCSMFVSKAKYLALDKELSAKKTLVKNHEKKLKKQDKRIDELHSEKESLSLAVQHFKDTLFQITGKVYPVPKTVIVTKTDTTKKETIFKGVELLRSQDVNDNISLQIEFKENRFDAYIVNDPKEIQIFWQKQQKKHLGNLGKLKAAAAKNKKDLIFGMNAGIFKPNRAPEGFLVANSDTLAPLNVRPGKGNFYLQPNGVFYIDETNKAAVLDTEAFKNKALKIRLATQSGPMLVINGKINDQFTENSKYLNIRNGVGVNDRGEVIFLISNHPINLYTFSGIFRDHFQCKYALYLDGAISRAYLPELEREEMQGDFGPLLGIYADEALTKDK